MKTKYHVLVLSYSKKHDMYSSHICYYDKGKLEAYILPIKELCVLAKNSYFVKNPRVSFLCSMPKRYAS